MKDHNELLSVEKALELVLEKAADLGTEKVPLDQALGRTLREDILADRDMPPFDRVSMDGIAISYEAYQSGKRSFGIEGVQAAGASQLKLRDPANCIEAMTGAMLPINTDVVIPYEQVHIGSGTAEVQTEAINYFQNIHKKGLDRKEKDLLLQKNTRITAAEIGVLATVGKQLVEVAKLPRVAVVSTGDELVEVSATPKPFQIRKSNVYTLTALLESWKIQPDLYHLQDDPAALRHRIGSLLKEYDALLFSGAVSRGKFDFLPEILEELGVKKMFHRVRQRPGKPFWFGTVNEKTVFAFPGNPVSTFVSCLKYFVPWLIRSTGAVEQKAYAQLSEDFEFRPELAYFLQVKLKNVQGVLYALPAAGNGSGDLANLSEADAFLELPANRSYFKKGEAFPLLQYRQQN